MSVCKAEVGINAKNEDEYRDKKKFRSSRLGLTFPRIKLAQREILKRD